ncbi:hypothetical protein [Legionella brunensis]|uniref:Uncharacterized protein n=1 Tax=Legionella brunensis TaxID=29422 RepID=A0A0W0S4M0_9GAMM|nr:hypothetical protein [Legionella brunensis]KTC78314.1 hypothetical protein Lbru_2606 [Legionella brunensis]
MKNFIKGNQKMTRTNYHEILTDYIRSEQDAIAIPNLKFLINQFDENSHQGSVLIKNLLASVLAFTLETESRWNATGTKERLNNLLKKMAVSIQKYETEYPKITLNEEDDAQAFLSALTYSKKCILHYMEKANKHCKLYEVYTQEENDLKTIFSKMETMDFTCKK